MINFDNTPPEWNVEGTEPTAEEKTQGWAVEDKVPAPYLNWFWTKVSKCLKELQSKLSNENTERGTLSQSFTDHKNGKNPHGITVKTISAAKDDLSNVDDDVFKKKVESNVTTGTPIVMATSTDGETYTATVEGITELYNGLEITIIPNMTSTKAAVQFDLNGLGARNLRAKINGYNNGNSGTIAAMAGWLGQDAPLTIRYISKFDNWQTVDFSRPSASGLYGTIKPTQGGTGITAENETDLILQLNKKINIPAASTDGVNYHITLEGVESGADLYPGLTIVIRPTLQSTTSRCNLVIDNMQDESYKSRGIFIYSPYDGIAHNLPSADWIKKSRAITLRFNGDAWYLLDTEYTAPNQLLGNVPVEKGGTGANTAEKALENLGALPLSGGVMTGQGFYLNNKSGRIVGNQNGMWFRTASSDVDNNEDARHLKLWNSTYQSNLTKSIALFDTQTGKDYLIHGEHNKPSDSYTGNGSATSRTVAVGGIGEVLTITSDIGMALVTNRGAICLDRQAGTVSGLKSYEVNYQNGVLTIATTSTFVNQNATSYWYQVL